MSSVEFLLSRNCVGFVEVLVVIGVAVPPALCALYSQPFFAFLAACFPVLSAFCWSFAEAEIVLPPPPLTPTLLARGCNLILMILSFPKEYLLKGGEGGDGEVKRSCESKNESSRLRFLCSTRFDSPMRTFPRLPLEFRVLSKRTIGMTECLYMLLLFTCTLPPWSFNVHVICFCVCRPRPRPSRKPPSPLTSSRFTCERSK